MDGSGCAQQHAACTITDQRVLVDLPVRREHALHHELVLVLLVGVVLERLQAHWGNRLIEDGCIADTDLLSAPRCWGPPPRVGLDAVPGATAQAKIQPHLLGAVVLILKQTFLSDGFFSFM